MRHAREALEGFTPNRHARWVLAQAQLGASLTELAERRSDTGGAEHGVRLCRTPLATLSTEQDVARWPAVLKNLGDALAALGRCAERGDTLEEAPRCLDGTVGFLGPNRFALLWRDVCRKRARIEAELGR